MTTLKNNLDRLSSRPILFTFSLAMLLNLIIETLSRRSLGEGLIFAMSNPLLFTYNALIIMLTLSVSFLIKKRAFMIILVSSTWLCLGIGNFVLLSFRTTPLAAIDFALINSVYEIIDVYLTTPQIVAVATLLILLIASIIMLWFKAPSRKVCYIRSTLMVLFMGISVIGATTISLKANAISDNYGNLADAYDDYGFAYCFSRSVIDRGIDKPETYSEDAVNDILKEIQKKAVNNTKVKPNIVFVQLESFFDVNRLIGPRYSENPIPNFTYLKKYFSSGFLTVPSIGAGTANTEFEVLSGMNLEYFGTGEYPYKTILKSKTSESIAYNLSKIGYTSHAIHNNSGTFYDRHLVFPNLGFDTFTSLEFMQDVEFSPTDWAKDRTLTTDILNALNSTEGRDFVFSISVQPHGKYPDEVMDLNQKISVSGLADVEKQVAFEYYVNQLHESDAFVGQLVSTLSNYSEPVVVVFYGDHLPSFNISNTDLTNQDVFQTEYVVWSNYGIRNENRDLYAYQLSADVMARVGFHNGILTKLHQNYSDNPNYFEALEMIQYDMLYGDEIVYRSYRTHNPTTMRMGVSDIRIKRIRSNGDLSYLYGENFTPWSIVHLNGSRTNTYFIDETTLMIENINLNTGTAITVSQVGNDRFPLSTTNTITYIERLLN